MAPPAAGGADMPEATRAWVCTPPHIPRGAYALQGLQSRGPPLGFFPALSGMVGGSAPLPWPRRTRNGCPGGCRNARAQSYAVWSASWQRVQKAPYTPRGAMRQHSMTAFATRSRRGADMPCRSSQTRPYTVLRQPG